MAGASSDSVAVANSDGWLVLVVTAWLVLVSEICVLVCNSGMLDDISKSMNLLDDTIKDEEVKTYSDYQAKAFEHFKKLTTCAQEMVLKSSSSPGEMCDSSRTLTIVYADVVNCSCGAMATLESHDITTRLKSHCNDLGKACKELVQSGASVQGNPSDAPSKRMLADCSRVVVEKVKS